MSETQDRNTHYRLPEPRVVRQTLTHIAVHSARLIKQSVRRQARAKAPKTIDTSSVAKAFLRMGGKLAVQPRTVLLAQVRLVRDHTALWAGTLAASLSNQPLKVAEPQKSDRRFRDPAWVENLLFNVIKQAYLLASRWTLTTIADVRGLDHPTRRKLDFYTRQFTDAMAPTNFLMTNPQVLRTTLESGGENLLLGLRNLLRDMDEGGGRLRIRMTDPDAFEVGGNLANTPGQVVYQNELIQLIQYTPSTERVHRRPLLVVPPWINRYYILDLGEKKSFIRHWVAEGHTVFVISWVNPDATLANKGFEDYMLEGPIAALDAIEKATGERKVNAVGYCIGGTLLGCALAWLAARDDRRVQSATFLNSLLDFSEVGDLEVFIDEHMLREIEDVMDRQGYLEGSSMATAFNMLRANDLIWSFFISNYLLGRESFPFDLLYWNGDSTRMPAAMHSFYLRNMYQHNRLREPGGITLAGEPIDLAEIGIPAYFASAIDDHIAPWVSCYLGSQHLSGPVRFVLGGSGHIAGIINPPAQNKYGYWTNEDNPSAPQTWLDSAERHEGSWWPDWTTWIEPFGGGEVAARQPGDGALPVIEPAPGAYARDEPAPPVPAPTRRKRTGGRKKTGTPKASRSSRAKA